MMNINNFLNIFVLLYIDFKHLDICYENYEDIFKKDISIINKNSNDEYSIKIIDNKFIINNKNNSKLVDLLGKLLTKSISYNELLNIEENTNDLVIKNIIDFFKLLNEINQNGGKAQTIKISLYKYRNKFVYDTFSAMDLAFKGEKNLGASIPFISSMIQEYKISTFYMLRVRNLFLYFYQTIIGREKFYITLSNNSAELYDSKYIKIVFSDIILAKKLNFNNPIIGLFEGFILLHLLDVKGVEVLLNLNGKIKEDIFQNDIQILISNYYIDVEEYSLAKKILNNSKIKKNFKYYRKYIPILMQLNEYKELSDMIIELIKSKKYNPYFYIQGDIKSNLNCITNSDVIAKNESLNLILNIDKKEFINLVYSLDKNLQKLLSHLKRNHRDYFLHKNDIAIILINNYEI